MHLMLVHQMHAGDVVSRDLPCTLVTPRHPAGSAGGFGTGQSTPTPAAVHEG
jgi:hypothetical protein